MKAAIIAVGTEMLATQRVDTNSLHITELFERFGIELIGKAVAGDELGALADVIKHYAAAVDLLVITGGLGPTADDITREAVSQAFGRSMRLDEELVEELRQRFASYGIKMADSNRRQAMVIDGASVLDNAHGSAPGLMVVEKQCHLMLLPGVPREMRAMVEVHLLPWIAARCDVDAGTGRRVLKVACVGESTLEERILPVYDEFSREDISVLAKPGEVILHVVARGPVAQREAKLEAMQQRLRTLAGRRVYTDQPDDELETVVGRLLIEHQMTVTTAESCTGGLVAERLTRVPGSSGFFLGGIVSYSNALKEQLLGVDSGDLERFGAVSEEVARQMAQQVLTRLGSEVGIGITGIAGPGGGSDEKPVGTVHVVVAMASGEVEHRCLHLFGGRQRVRQLTSQWALEMTRQMLLAR